MKCRGCRRSFAPCNDEQRKEGRCGPCKIQRHLQRDADRNELAMAMDVMGLDYSWDDLLAQLRRILVEHREREPAARFMEALRDKGLVVPAAFPINPEDPK